MHANHPSHQAGRSFSIYNSRNPQMLPSSRVRWFVCALLLCSHLMFATDWNKPVAQLAGKIANVTGPGVVALEISNRSSISGADVEQIRRNLTTELASSGVRVWQPDQAAATIKLTLSENLESYVWVAEVHQGTAEPNIVMVTTDRPAIAAAAQNMPPMALHATPLMSQHDAILDVAVLDGSPRRALVLTGSTVTLYVSQDNHWLAAQALQIPHAVPFPRDLRGRIILRKDHLFDAYLPGVVCHSADSTNGLSMACTQSDDPWPLEIPEVGLSGFFAPARNFFTGALVPGIGKQKSAPNFYAAAAVPKDRYVLWLFTGIDGQLHLLDGINQQTAGKLRWGSDIAGIHASCRPDWQVLATAPGSDEEDSIQAFEFPDREPAAVSQKLAINGTVTALWTGQNAGSVTAIFRNSETGDYEALQLTLTCSQ